MEPNGTFDIVGVGIGPFNLGLAALADAVPELSVRCYDARPAFRWHPGMMVPGATVQVNFLADLVTLVEPTSRWSFLSYLRARDRMYPFYIAERFHLPRREYDDYCRWVAGSLPSCVFGTRVVAVEWQDGAFTVSVERADGATEQVRARHLVLGVGTEPSVPAGLAPALGDRVFHSADYLDRVDGLDGCRHVAVVGSGQSGAEVFLDLLRRQPTAGWALSWLTRSPAFAPLDYSKLVLEYTTPDYVRFFHGLPAAVREPLLTSQWQLYKAVSGETLEAIFTELYAGAVDGTRPPVELRPTLAVDRIDRDAGGRFAVHGTHTLQCAPVTVEVDAVVLATGYAARSPACLAPVEHLLKRDDRGRLTADLDYRPRTAPELEGRIFVQNAELHTHGAATPDLGVGAFRNATILNQVAGREAFRLPKRTAFTTFAAR